MSDVKDFDGSYDDSMNMLSVTFRGNWKLDMIYTKKQDSYELSSIKLDYVVSKDLFPGVIDEEIGARSVFAGNLSEFSATLKKSYRCMSKTSLNLNQNVTMDITNYQGEPFLDKNTNEFDIGNLKASSLLKYINR